MKWVDNILYRSSVRVFKLAAIDLILRGINFFSPPFNSLSLIWSNKELNEEESNLFERKWSISSVILIKSLNLFKTYSRFFYRRNVFELSLVSRDCCLSHMRRYVWQQSQYLLELRIILDQFVFHFSTLLAVISTNF